MLNVREGNIWWLYRELDEVRHSVYSLIFNAVINNIKSVSLSQRTTQSYVERTTRLPDRSLVFSEDAQVVSELCRYL